MSNNRVTFLAVVATVVGIAAGIIAVASLVTKKGDQGDFGLRGVPGPPGPSVAVGVIAAWPLKQVPANWLICDGGVVSRTDYPELAAVFERVAFPYGAGDGATTFRLPDYRGYFLRGLDNPGTPEGLANRDPEGGTRRVGSPQEHAFAEHSHSLIGGGKAPEIGELERFDVAFASGSARNNAAAQAGHKTLLEGRKETRPMNVAVNWIIYAQNN